MEHLFNMFGGTASAAVTATGVSSTATAAAAAAAAATTIDRTHPHLQALDGLQLSYPGYERDKREAEAVHYGTSSLNLSFDAALRRLKVKQRAHEEQKSMRSIHRSHPNLVALDSLKLTYPGWQKDVERAEKVHNNNNNVNSNSNDNNNSNGDFGEILRKLQVKQFRHENDRSHYRLKEIDNLKLSYPGWKADIRNLEKFHFEEAFFLPGDSLFQSKLDGLRRRQQIFTHSQNLRGRNRCSSNLDQTEATTAADNNNEEENNNVNDDKSDDNTCEVININNVNVASKGSYAILFGRPESENLHLDGEPHDESRSYSETDNSGHSDDERRITDHLPTRKTPYAIIADTTESTKNNKGTREPEHHLLSSVSMRSATIDPPHRPDPPEETKRQGIDCDEEVSDSESKTDPEGINLIPSNQQQNRQWQNKLSSYIDPDPIVLDRNEANEETDETDETDDVYELPSATAGRFAALSHQTKYRAEHNNRRDQHSTPRGNYSCPLLPTDEEYSMSDDISVISASSSRAVWAESPMPYVPSTPSSIQAVHSIQSTPRDIKRPITKSAVLHRPRPESRQFVRTNKKKNSTNNDNKAQRRRRTNREEGSRISRDSSSRNSSKGSGRPKKLGRCAICGDRDKNHVFVPCGHLCACQECAGQVITRKMACPVCRGSVTEAIQVYL